jgi:hypothetical protein
MKKLLLSLFVLFSISANAQCYNYHPIQGIQPYNNMETYQEPIRVKNNILPTIIGAIIGATIVNSVYGDQYYNNQRFAIRQHYYQNQLEIQRLELLQMQLENIEMQNYHRQSGFLGIFHKRHHRY